MRYFASEIREIKDPEEMQRFSAFLHSNSYLSLFKDLISCFNVPIRNFSFFRGLLSIEKAISLIAVESWYSEKPELLLILSGNS